MTSDENLAFVDAVIEELKALLERLEARRLEFANGRDHAAE